MISNKILMLVIVGLLIALIFSITSSRTTVLAQGAAAGNVAAVTGNTDSQARDLLYVIDTSARSLCVYEVLGGKLNLVAARNIKFDFMLDEWRPRTQKPSVKEVYDETRKKIKKDSTPPKKRK